MKTTLIPFLAILCAAGCVQPHGYVNPASENFARPEVATLYDMKTAVVDLVAQMQDDEGFQEHYELRASKKHDLPVLQIGNIDPISTNRVAQKLDIINQMRAMNTFHKVVAEAVITDTVTHPCQIGAAHLTDFFLTVRQVTGIGGIVLRISPC